MEGHFRREPQSGGLHIDPRAKLNCCTRGGTSSDVELGKAVPAVEETVLPEVMGTVVAAGTSVAAPAVEETVSREVMGTVVAAPAVEETVSREVMGTVVGEPAREPPPLHDIVDALKKNLGLDGTWPEVVDAACLQLGVAPTGSLQEKADECWRAAEG